MLRERLQASLTDAAQCEKKELCQKLLSARPQEV